MPRQVARTYSTGFTHLLADGAPLPGAMSETISGKGFAISGKQASDFYDRDRLGITECDREAQPHPPFEQA